MKNWGIILSKKKKKMGGERESERDEPRETAGDVPASGLGQSCPGRA